MLLPPPLTPPIVYEQRRGVSLCQTRSTARPDSPFRPRLRDKETKCTLKDDKFGGVRRSESPCPTTRPASTVPPPPPPPSDLTSVGEECSACDLKCMLVSAGGKRIAHIFHRRHRRRGFWWCGMRVSDCENCGRGAQSNNRSERNNGRDPSEVSRVTSAFVLSRSSSHLSLCLYLYLCQHGSP